MEGQTPEPSPQSATGGGRQLRTAGAIALAVLLAAGGFVAGRVTAGSVDAEAAAPTTPLPDAVDLQVGEPLDWQRSGSIGETWPVSLVEYQDSLYLFATPERDFSSLDGSGLDAWISDDGRTWASLGTVIESPHLVSSVTSTSQGLVALGSDGTSGSPSVWVSSDGLEWSASVLPTDESDPAGSRTWLTTAGGTEDLLVVFGSTQFDVQRLIFDALPEEYKTEGADYPYGMGWGGPPFEVTIQGPLGITVFSATAEDLGLSEEEVAMLMRGAGPGLEAITVWSSFDRETWVVSEIDATGISHVSTTPNGDLMAFGHTLSAAAIWFSNDGIEWEHQAASGRADQVISWNGGLVGVRHLNMSTELVYSTDGQQWDPLAIDALPTEDSMWWSYNPIAAGEAGIAVAAHGIDRSAMFGEPGPIVLNKDGYTLTVEQMSGSLVLSRGDTEVLQLFLHGQQVQEEVAVDFKAQTITFLHPDTSAALVTFTFDEIDRAQQESYEDAGSGNQQRALLFSTDGVEWSAHDLDRTFGPDWQIDRLHVTSDGVVAAITHPPTAFTGSPQPSEVQMWFAPIP